MEILNNSAYKVILNWFSDRSFAWRTSLSNLIEDKLSEEIMQIVPRIKYTSIRMSFDVIDFTIELHKVTAVID